MPILDPSYTLAAARSAGRTTWPLRITNWGNNNGLAPAPPYIPADENSLIFPAAGQPELSNIFGAMIAPDSLWDRCTLRYVANATALTKDTTVVQQDYALSVGSPVMFALPGRILVLPYAQVGGGGDALWGGYILAAGSTPSPLLTTSTVSTLPEQARLSLIFFLQAPAMAPTQRAPVTCTTSGTFSGAGAEAGPLVLNVSGRKTAQVLAYPLTNAGIWSIRAAVLNSSSAPLPKERDVATVAAVTSPTGSAEFSFALGTANGLPADWLLIWATRTGGGAGDTSLAVSCYAYD